MRSAFAAGLVEVAAADERIILLTADLGYTVLEPFAERFPDRFMNVGVAEQNMVGMATGLAEAGYTPYVYSIATFASMRGYEFIRNGPVLHQLPVRVVGVGGGLDYGHNGLTHYAVEDVALMRTQPDLTIVAPADPDQVRTAVPVLQQLNGPVYLRLGKESASVPGLMGRFRLGGVEAIGDGRDVVFVTLGGAAAQAVEAATLLSERGVEASVAVVSSLNPSPSDDLAVLLGETELAISVEAHYVAGGVGSFAAETIAERRLACRLVRAGLRETPVGETGSRDHLYARHGLMPEQLAAAALQQFELAGR
ncbi:transketolase C-terminal domain-containing protein [Conexibacter sp. JD483]|uniref:transketolase family protein n=1 Tax=unclassified Conexibacter TaxID=2627773 RepID=UPI00271D06AA|nr:MULTISPECIES: transketolase C-terminal domain-containing protein [unclassified Conexibacter]MDO8184189.1 transketolase C-terminal domain-containing protein [Conexibacter sp. CPCC 205706]MDO8197181.1 transketolase C-terminal domain-containing protein [Conexibacter sp. CPCC 205762]MDR9367504.1 transketolase C-terminal domain-containing protein [Conexibacter sp. JD483]